MRSARRHWCLMTALAAVSTGVLTLVGGEQLMLYCTPLLLIAGLLMSGRFVGEGAILARRLRRAAAGRLRAPRRLPRPVSERPLASLLARCPSHERAPPAVVALTA